LHGRAQQSLSEQFRMGGLNSTRRGEDPRFVLAPLMLGVETVIDKFLQFDNRVLGVG
jgi:hypothetical protein